MAEGGIERGGEGKPSTVLSFFSFLFGRERGRGKKTKGLGD